MGWRWWGSWRRWGFDARLRRAGGEETGDRREGQKLGVGSWELGDWRCAREGGSVYRRSAIDERLAFNFTGEGLA